MDETILKHWWRKEIWNEKDVLALYKTDDPDFFENDPEPERITLPLEELHVAEFEVGLSTGYQFLTIANIDTASDYWFLINPEEWLTEGYSSYGATFESDYSNGSLIAFEFTDPITLGSREHNRDKINILMWKHNDHTFRDCLRKIAEMFTDKGLEQYFLPAFYWPNGRAIEEHEMTIIGLNSIFYNPAKKIVFNYFARVDDSRPYPGTYQRNLVHAAYNISRAMYPSDYLFEKEPEDWMKPF